MSGFSLNIGGQKAEKAALNATKTKYPWGDDLFAHPNPFVLSFSSRSTLHTCARKFEFSKLFDKRPQYESMEAEVGKAMHAGYQKWLETKDEDAAIWAYMKAYPISMNPDPYDGRSLEAGYASLKRLFIDSKLMEYKLAYIKDMHGKLRPAVEVEFEIWVDGPLFLGRPIVYVGFIDAILYDVISGKYMVVDLKSHRRAFLNMDAEYKYHGQCTPYGIVIQQIAGHDINEFEVAYVAPYIDVFEPYTTTIKVEKHKQDVQDWATNLWFDIKSLQQYAALDFFPRKETGCMSYKYPCQYLEICVERRKEVIELWLDDEAKRVGKVRQERSPNAWIRFTLNMPE